MLQATKFTADFVDERIEAFVSWFLEDKVKNLSDEEYAEVVSTLVKMQKQADVTLTEEFDRNWYARLPPSIQIHFLFGTFYFSLFILDFNSFYF